MGTSTQAPDAFALCIAALSFQLEHMAAREHATKYSMLVVLPG